VAFREALEEGGAIDPIEGGGGPVEHFHEAERAQARGRGNLTKERLDHGHMQVVGGRAPVELVGGIGMFFAPQHPGGKDSVEERLHQGRAEEVIAAVALEGDAEGFLEGDANGVERGQVGALDAHAGIAGVGGQEPGDIFGVGQRRAAEHDAPQVFGEALGVLVGEEVWVGRPEGGFRCREAVALQVARRAVGVAADEQEVAVVGDQHLAVAGEVFGDLAAGGDLRDVVGQTLDLKHAAGGDLGGDRDRVGVFSELVGCVEAAVGDAGAKIARVHDAAHFGLEGCADGVEQVGQRSVEGGFGDADRASVAQFA